MPLTRNSRMTSSAILLLCFIFFVPNCFAQDDSWQSLTISDGLSQGMVNDMMQDREGFMWFATKDGLNRYDGYNFKVFTRDPYNPHSISGNFCKTLLEDSKGRIWIGTEKDGLNLYNPKTQRFSHILISDKGLKDAENYAIDYLKEDKNGAIWIITPQIGKYFKIPPSQLASINNGALPVVEPVIISRADQIPDFVGDRHPLEVGHAKNLYRLDKEFAAQEKELAESAFIMKDRDGYFWATGFGEIMYWKGTTFKKVNVPKIDVPMLSTLQDGSVAVCFSRNVWLLKNASELDSAAFLPRKAINGFFKAENAASQLYSPFNNIFLDQQGNIWAGNLGYGLIKLNRYTRFFQSFLPFVSAGFLYQSREGKVYVHGNSRPSFHYFELNKAENVFKRLPEKLYQQKREHEALIQDMDQDFWLTIWNGQRLILEKYSRDWQLLKTYPLSQMHHADRRNAKLMEDSKGKLWVGHVNGTLLRLDEQTGQFITYQYRSVLPKGGALLETSALYEDARHTLWIGTQGGLIRAENFQTKPSFSIYQNSSEDRESLSENVVSGMVDDPLEPGRYLWVGTKGGGLERMDKHTGKFEHFNESRGLPNKVVYGVLVGNDNNLWMSTNRGIARLNPKTLAFTNFNKSDGLQDDEFNTASYFRAASGELLFGGVKGVTTFTPSDLTEKQAPPVVKILGLKINNQAIEPDDESGILNEAIQYATELDLAFDQNQVSIEFGAMDFTNPSKNRFRYQMEGIDKDWVEAGTDHFANFAQLPDGHYTFRVQGTTNGEVWSKPVTLKIRINPPFYLTWWAYLAYMVLIGYVGFRFYQNQLKRVRLQEQIHFKEKETGRLEELDLLKTRFFTNISHEFRTPLTLILGPVDDLQKKFPNEGIIPVVQRNTKRLLALINQLLDLGKLDAREMRLHLQTGDLAQFMQHLGSSFQSLAESRAIDFQLHQNERHFFIPFDADKIEKIVTNLLSNAFKFTASNGSVEMNVAYETNSVSITLKDTGIGIAPEKRAKIFDRFYQADNSGKRNYEGTGIGLALVKELVDLLQGNIQVESQVGVGTTFYIQFPIKEQPGEVVEENDESDVLPVFTSHFLSERVEEVQMPENGSKPKTEKNEEILLIAEDNDDLRAYIRSVFDDTYRVIEAADGKEGFDLAIKYIPDIVISDLMMPEMDGFELCQALKTNEKTSHIPVVVLTAKATLQDRIEGFEIGADDYLVKPFNAMEIKTRVRNLIVIRENLKKYYAQSMIGGEAALQESGSLEEPFIRKVKATLATEFGNSSFDVEQLAEEMNMSSSQLLRKLKALTNLTTVEFIREYRLQKAANLLAQKSATVSEIAYLTGFESLPYFTKVFQQKYKILPSEY